MKIMLRANEIRRKGAWDGVAVDTVVLCYDDRYRRRMTMTGTGGLDFVLDLPKAGVLADGDALVLSDGRLVAVKAAAEPLLEITCADPVHLAKVAAAGPCRDQPLPPIRHVCRHRSAVVCPVR